MKKQILSFSILATLILLSLSCDKESMIVYPETGYFGDNILREGEKEIIGNSYLWPATRFYSMQVQLPEGVSLKILMTKLPGATSSISRSSSSSAGWAIDNMNEKSTAYYATGPVTSDVEICFYENGSAELLYFINGEEEASRVDTISWE